MKTVFYSTPEKDQKVVACTKVGDFTLSFAKRTVKTVSLPIGRGL